MLKYFCLHFIFSHTDLHRSNLISMSSDNLELCNDITFMIGGLNPRPAGSKLSKFGQNQLSIEIWHLMDFGAWFQTFFIISNIEFNVVKPKVLPNYFSGRKLHPKLCFLQRNTIDDFSTMNQDLRFKIVLISLTHNFQ